MQLHAVIVSCWNNLQLQRGNVRSVINSSAALLICLCVSESFFFYASELICVCIHCHPGELGDCDPLEHSPELVSEFRFTPKQSEAMEADIFGRWLDLR